MRLGQLCVLWGITNRVNIQVIRWLIKQKQIRVHEEGFGQRYAHAPSTGKFKGLSATFRLKTFPKILMKILVIIE